MRIASFVVNLNPSKSCRLRETGTWYLFHGKLHFLQLIITDKWLFRQERKQRRHTFPRKMKLNKKCEITKREKVEKHFS